MKKFIVFIFLAGCLGCTGFVKLKARDSIFDLSGVKKVCLVCEEELEEMESVRCGDYVFNYCSLDIAKEKYDALSTKGVQLYFEEVDLDEFLDELFKQLKIEVVSESHVKEISILQCYTPYFQDCVYIDNKKVNVQIATTSEGVIAGFPMILTGF